MNPSLTFTQPERVGRYEVLVPIASGGMATVYLARSVGFGGFEREVALKLTHAHLRENRDFATDMIEEAKLAARIRHPNVVSVFDVGEDPLGVFLVMDYVEGDTLGTLLTEAARREKPLPWRVGLRIVLDALAGLQAAHDLTDIHGRPAGLVHRDFSPQNILVGLDGIGRLTDFGIAKATSRLSHTTTGVVKGKLGYMSPEQIRGQPLDLRSDVWAAGVVAWEVVAGRRLFSGEEAAVVFRIATEAPPRVDTVVPETNESTASAIARALTLDPRQRCPSAAAFAKALLSSLADPTLLADRGEVADVVRELVLDKIEARREAVRRRAAGEHAAPLAPATGEDTSSRGVVAVTPVSAVSPTATTDRRALQDSPAPPARVAPKHLALGAGLLLSAVAVLVLVVRTPAVEPSAPAASATPSENAAQPATAQTSAPAEPAPTASAMPGQFITIVADVPLKSLVVEGKPIPVQSPSRTFGIQVSDVELERGIAVEAIAADGRGLRVIGERGQTAFVIAFGRQPSGRDSSSGKRLPFAPNPYATPPKP